MVCILCKGSKNVNEGICPPFYCFIVSTANFEVTAGIQVQDRPEDHTWLIYLPLSVLMATSIVSPSVVYTPLYTLPNAPVA